VPAATDRAIVSKLNRDFNDILQRSDIKERFTALGLEIDGGSPDYFSSVINADIERLSQLVKAANIRTTP
jgi:tripartite-type tricarboxylate transporter receptor subunit TctC